MIPTVAFGSFLTGLVAMPVYAWWRSRLSDDADVAEEAKASLARARDEAAQRVQGRLRDTGRRLRRRNG